MKTLLSFLLCVLVLFSSAGFSEEEPAVTVSGVPVPKAEAYVYLLSAETEYAEIVEYYKNYLGVNYWSLEYANGMTVSQMVKSDVFKELLMMNLFYAMAQEKNLRLSADEKNACREDAKNTYALLPVSAASYLTEDALFQVFEKQRLADRMYSLLLSETEIDEESIIRSVNKDDFKTYEVEYLFRSNTDYSANGKAMMLTPEKEAEVLKAFERAAALESLEDTVSLYPDLDLLYANAVFSHEDTQIDRALMAVVTRLSPGETGRVARTDYGLFLIRLISNEGSAAYDAQVAEKLYQAREAAFSETYNRLFMNAEYEINVSFWDAVTPGMMRSPD